MDYELIIKRKVEKKLQKFPEWVQKKFTFLIKDLQEIGPEQPTWQNYSKLSQTKYHCHIGKSWVACWKHEDKTIEIEVYYVGNREKAPY